MSTAIFKCSKCGCDCHPNPRAVPLKDEKGKPIVLEYEGTDERGKAVKKKTHKMKDLEVRGHHIQLRMGFAQTISRWFCGKCLDDIQPEMKALWDKLKGYGA